MIKFLLCIGIIEKSLLASNGLLNAVTETSISFASGSLITHSVFNANSMVPKILLLAVE